MPLRSIVTCPGNARPLKDITQGQNATTWKEVTKNPNSSSPSSKKNKSTDGDSKKKSVTIKAEPVDQKPLQLENQNANYNGKSILKEQQEEKKVISP